MKIILRMKKLILFFVLVLYVLMAQAWISPSGQMVDGENTSISVKVDDLKSPADELGDVSSFFANAPTGALLPMRLWIRSATSRFNMMVVKNKGIKGIMVGSMESLVGNALSTPIISVEGSDISPGYRPIHKIEVWYYKLDPNENTPLVDPNIAKFSELSARPENGIYTYYAVIEPYFPLTHLMLGYSFDKLKKNHNNIVAETYDDPNNPGWSTAAGYVITAIKVTSDYGSSTFAEHRREFNSMDAMGKAFLTANTSTVRHYNTLAGADLNEDGVLNSADIVTIYNTIANGRPDFVDGHEYVDLELPSGTLWATCNVGSLVPEGYGDFLSWTERKNSLFTGKTNFTSSNFDPIMKKSSVSPGMTPANSAFATGALGIYSDWKEWALPDVNTWREILDNTTQEVVKINNVLCYKFTSNFNGKSIILPAAGSFNEQGYRSTSEDGYDVDLLYWSRTVGERNEENVASVHVLGFYQGIMLTEAPAYYGASMRMVHERLSK